MFPYALFGLYILCVEGFQRGISLWYYDAEESEMGENMGG